MQTKLDKFFSITINHNDNIKKCFIYDPKNNRAFFENKPDEKDIFQSIKSGIKLYYRHHNYNNIINIPKIYTNFNIPLLKSNLQKAIRRCNLREALNSALCIIQKSPIELLRRLPIIYIEDVCLMDSFPIVVWLMMAEKEHKLDVYDIDILLNIIKNLCECSDYYDDQSCHITDRDVFDISHIKLQNYEHKDCLLSIYYRALYGGMKGDIIMLKNSIYYYLNNSYEIKKTIYNTINYINYDTKLDIIPEAIDFHPFPHIINILVKQTNLDNNIIKEHIWFVESGVNIRKQNTIKNSEYYSSSNYWKIIKSKLIRVRYNLIQAI